MGDSVEYSTPWFELVSRPYGGATYYSLRMSDYVIVVPVTEDREIVLVRQYRPAVGQFTLELPAGHVEKGQTPEEAAQAHQDASLSLHQDFSYYARQEAS